MSSSVEVVLEQLERAGFQKLPKPLVVAGASFDFDAAVTGTGVSHDLVVVGGQEVDPRRLSQLLSGLNRSLDRLASRRPVSVILLGARPEAAALAELENSARVMLIESQEPEPAEVQDAIAVLLPLHLPETTRKALDPLDELLKSLGRAATDEHRELINAARRGPESVRATLRRYLEDAVGEENSEEMSA